MAVQVQISIFSKKKGPDLQPKVKFQSPHVMARAHTGMGFPHRSHQRNEKNRRSGGERTTAARRHRRGRRTDRVIGHLRGRPLPVRLHGEHWPHSPSSPRRRPLPSSPVAHRDPMGCCAPARCSVGLNSFRGVLVGAGSES